MLDSSRKLPEAAPTFFLCSIVTQALAGGCGGVSHGAGPHEVARCEPLVVDDSEEVVPVVLDPEQTQVESVIAAESRDPLLALPRGE